MWESCSPQQRIILVERHARQAEKGQLGTYRRKVFAIAIAVNGILRLASSSMGLQQGQQLSVALGPDGFAHEVRSSGEALLPITRRLCLLVTHSQELLWHTMDELSRLPRQWLHCV